MDLSEFDKCNWPLSLLYLSIVNAPPVLVEFRERAGQRSQKPAQNTLCSKCCALSDWSTEIERTIHAHSLFLIDFKCLELLQDITPEGRGRRTAHLAWVVATVARTARLVWVVVSIAHAALIPMEYTITRAVVMVIPFAAASLPFPFVLLHSSLPAWPSSSLPMTDPSVLHCFSLHFSLLVGTMSMLRSGRETSSCRS